MKLSKMGKKYPIAMTLFPCAQKHCWTHLLYKAVISITNQCYIEYSNYFITKVGYLVCFFLHILGYVKVAACEDMLVFILSSNLKWSFVQFVWGCTLLYVCSLYLLVCFQYLFLKDRTPGRSGNKTVLTPYFKYRHNLDHGWSKHVPRKYIFHVLVNQK